jgi:hypothetical protein
VAAGTIPGHEIEHPMAVVILGGLLTSTVVNLFIVPPLYLRFAGTGHTHPRPDAPAGPGAVPKTVRQEPSGLPGA